MPGGNGRLVGDVAKGAVAGAVGVWLMDRVGWILYQREDRAALRREHAARPEGKDPAHVAAGKVARALGLRLSSAQPHPAGIVVHYALGVVPGALYGPFRRRVKGLGAGRGVLYGLGLFLVNDEGLAPLLGLAAGPAAYPWQAHARGLAAHLVLGAVTDAALDAMDRI